MRRVHDAIVIGAGLSGLVCARTLADAGLRVRVLEARDRVGGRLLNGEVGGAIVDLGGQWLTAGQHRLMALCERLGVATYEHTRSGKAIIDEAGGRLVKIAAAFAQQRAMSRIETLMKSVPIGEPANAPNAALLDRVAFNAYLDETVKNAIARERIRLHADLVFAHDPEGMSLLSYLATMHATEGFKPAGADLPGGGREHRFDGGAQTLPLRLAEGLDIAFDEPVIAIDQAAHVTVRTETGRHTAHHVVLAVPPGLVKRIAVELPTNAQSYVDGVRMGSVVKVFAAYETAFWGERGFSGEIYRPHGAVRAVVEMDGQPPALLAFVVGPEAAHWHERTARDRRAEVLATVATYFGDRALRPIAFVEKDWAADPWSAGCVAATVPNVLSRGARWREPFGRVHIAGTESAVHWPGYMDGAIEAGERAAAEIIGR